MNRMKKSNKCFYCQNSGQGEIVSHGWYNECKLGIENDGLMDIESCEKWAPNNGFQIGGYYTHMVFEYGSEPNGCMEWKIYSDGEFPCNDADIQFHICDFRQIEEFVKFWGKYLRKIGAVTDDVS